MTPCMSHVIVVNVVAYFPKICAIMCVFLKTREIKPLEVILCDYFFSRYTFQPEKCGFYSKKIHIFHEKTENVVKINDFQNFSVKMWKICVQSVFTFWPNVFFCSFFLLFCMQTCSKLMILAKMWNFRNSKFTEYVKLFNI